MLTHICQLPTIMWAAERISIRRKVSHLNLLIVSTKDPHFRYWPHFGDLVRLVHTGQCQYTMCQYTVMYRCFGEEEKERKEEGVVEEQRIKDEEEGKRGGSGERRGGRRKKRKQ